MRKWARLPAPPSTPTDPLSKEAVDSLLRLRLESSSASSAQVLIRAIPNLPSDLGVDSLQKIVELSCNGTLPASSITSLVRHPAFTDATARRLAKALISHDLRGHPDGTSMLRSFLVGLVRHQETLLKDEGVFGHLLLSRSREVSSVARMQLGLSLNQEADHLLSALDTWGEWAHPTILERLLDCFERASSERRGMDVKFLYPLLSAPDPEIRKRALPLLSSADRDSTFAGQTPTPTEGSRSCRLSDDLPQEDETVSHDPPASRRFRSPLRS